MAPLGALANDRRERNILTVVVLLILFIWVASPTHGFSWNLPMRHNNGHNCASFSCQQRIRNADLIWGKSRLLPQPSRLQAGNTPATKSSPHSSQDEMVKGLVTNLFSVCAHLQNPDLYSPQWANHATLEQQQEGPAKLITTCQLQKGDIVTLYPLHALGLQTTTARAKRRKPKQNSKLKSNKKLSRDFMVFDQDKDGAYFQERLSQSLQKLQPLVNNYNVPVPLSLMLDDNVQHYDLFVDINPTRSAPTPGWMGHMATKMVGSDVDGSEANCRVVPIPGALPLCALIATHDMEKGTHLVVFHQQNLVQDKPAFDQTCAPLFKEKYRNEIQELGKYLAMAYQPPLQPAVLDEPAPREQQDGNSISGFHTINMAYPGLRYLHHNPDILVIDNFLTDEECDRITNNAKSHLIPCVIKHPTTGEVQEDPSRTSINANMPQSDVPSIVDKIVNLTNCQDATYLETMQILRYTHGQTFYPHTDGFQGPTTACGFEQSGRLVTIFCYLNDVPNGGETKFTELNPEVMIKPRKGMAVLHFPATLGLEEDPRTEHEGYPAIDEKWLLVTWMWNHSRTDPQYAEHLFPSIMGVAEQSMDQ